MPDKRAPKRAALRGRHGAQWITWLNESQGSALLDMMCTNQKFRAKDVIELKGAKTKW